MQLELNKELFRMSKYDFLINQDPKYTTLQLYPQLGICEREIGLITELFESYIDNEKIFINIGIRCSGYIPIQMIKKCNNVYIINENIELEQMENLNINLEKHDPNKKVKIINKLTELNIMNSDATIIFKLENIVDSEILKQVEKSNSIILSNNKLTLSNHKEYKLLASAIYIYITNSKIDSFEKNFRYYLESNNLNYNNLINLCMIVKNAGDGFKEILEKNLQYIDRWTILDTGSTDNTIKIIKDVLKSKKGFLYQEPFINFRESRNRCLELAGTSCKYTIMLDDTYILQGKVREFLEYIRSDQFADSYNIFIKSDNSIYGSNRILKSDRQLKYIYRIHEIIQNKNNIVVQLPIEQIHIDDIVNDYMIERTFARKEYDLKLLLETLEEYPNISRTYYYIAQTYSALKMWDKAFEYAIKRIEHPDKGYSEEITESYLICADIARLEFKWDWDKCENLYMKCYINDPLRADALYALGMYYKILQPKRAFEYLKKGYELGVPVHVTSNLRYDIYNNLLPKALIELCYQLKEYNLGEKIAKKYLTIYSDDTMLSYYKIFNLLNLNIPIDIKKDNKNIICFVSYNSFNDWNGESIYTEGLGGSETFIVELSRNIAKMTNFDVYVFCNTKEECKIDNVKYKKIEKYINFINTHKIHTCIISRYSEYVPVTCENDINNIYLVLHDLIPSTNIIPMNDKIKGIFCMTDWHKKYFLNIFPMMEKKTFIISNGININNYPNKNINKKKNSFIYSSTANRGLINLLKMFPKIKEKIPDATLNIFCDLNHKWVKSTANYEISLIEKLLEDQKEYIINHGWVKKDILTNFFIESEYWLYPCTFQETFCVTALEAASSCTLAVTNDLAGLTDTVGDRGIIIKGNPITEEWQEKAILSLIEIVNNSIKKNELITKNRIWAEAKDWTIITQDFINNYLKYNNELIKYYKPIEENIKYLSDMFSGCKKVLEIGPGKQQFPLSTHFVDHINNHNLDNFYMLDITQQKLPFTDNEFDLVYCRHVLEDIHNPEFVFNELYRVAKIIYIETPSPLIESTRHIDGTSPYYRGYIHHRYLIWVNNNQLNFLPKYPIIEYINIDSNKKIKDPYYWNTYFIWDKTNGIPTINYLKHDIDYNLHTHYETIVNSSIKESLASIKSYKKQIKTFNKVI